MTLSAPEPSSHPAAVPSSDPRQDPAMRSLYHMSRTAGVGLQDYAAVNVFAVIGVLLAVASVLVVIFADAPAMLILPAAAIVVSVIAFLQVQHSNGTQTGRGIALAGVVIALGLAGTNVYGRVSDAARQRADRAELEALVTKLQDAAAANKPTEAYELFDSRFHDTVQPETFARTLAAHVDRTFGGPRITIMKLGERVQFETDTNGVRFATALITVKAEGKTPQGFPLEGEEATEFRKVDDTWKIHSIINWFPATPAKPGTASPR
jgi:hypothetical protein